MVNDSGSLQATVEMNDVETAVKDRPAAKFSDSGEEASRGKAQIISMVNQKGGVGKTTSTINLGAALGELGHKVLLVDFDPQGALSAGFGVNSHELDVTVYNVLMNREVNAQEAVVKTQSPNVDLLPANIDLSAAEVQLVSEVAREQVLGHALCEVAGEYDVILIDCQPSLGLLTVNALTASDSIIIPLNAEFFALRAVALLTETIEKVRERLNPKLAISGILVTMFDSRTLHSKEVVERLVEAFGSKVFDVMISRTVKFPDANVAAQPITSYASNHVGAEQYRALAKELLLQKSIS